MVEKRLSHLLQALPQKEVVGYDERSIAAICYDSRRIQKGSLFVAIPGFNTDGHQFISHALAGGTAAVVAQRDRFDREKWDNPCPLILVPDSRRALALLSAAFYEYPARRLRMVGVTGTDGKTTTVYLICAVLEAAGYSTGRLTTVDFKIGERLQANETRQTTVESVELQGLLAEMVQEGVGYAVVEATSHGLALERVTGCEYDAAVFTNISHDHLDFHKTWEAYVRDKARLLEMLEEAVDKGGGKASILNADDQSFAFLRPMAYGVVITYGLSSPASVTARDVKLSASGSRYVAVTPLGEVDVSLRLPGIHNVYNSLAALALGLSQGLSLATIAEGLERASPVPGRMEVVDAGQPFTVVVDYAHTPQGMETILRTLRSLGAKRILVVFGAAGERDRGRRWGLGEVVGRLADFCVLTNEDPRWEDPMAIFEDIEVGLKEAGRQAVADYGKIAHRREAIVFALSMARPGDVVLVAGKGHETSIIVGSQRIPWDDRRAVREVLAKMGYSGG
ncbi:MAG: UDP-N-acetylmuramoyl-L-alanyl-D-glutamate--2,6-diaminopimelate ligase [Chloroflexi bacterium]|nr:UDP-N-acetylmuramoyl-L-alanyl-D-glutamate--2,6-diaminopimelate ligase [Chloroflexota bacterium]